MRKIICKLVLFLNAFLLMDILFLGKEIYLYLTGETYHNTYILIGIISLACFILGGLLGLIIIYRKPKNVSSHNKVLHKENVTGNYYFGYFSLFVLLFLSFDLSNVINLLIFHLLFIALAFVYCRNNLFYINPTIFLLGKRIYSVKIEKPNNKEETVLAFTDIELEINSVYKFYFTSLEYTVCEKI